MCKHALVLLRCAAFCCGQVASRLEVPPQLIWGATSNPQKGVGLDVGLTRECCQSCKVFQLSRVFGLVACFVAYNQMKMGCVLKNTPNKKMFLSYMIWYLCFTDYTYDKIFYNLRVLYSCISLLKICYSISCSFYVCKKNCKEIYYI